MTRRYRALVPAVLILAALAAMAWAQAADKAVDPVCGMTVVKAKAAATYDYKGATYYFCSTGCKDRFAKEPDKYLAKAAAPAVAATPAVPGAPAAPAAKCAGACGPDCPMAAQAPASPAAPGIPQAAPPAPGAPRAPSAPAPCCAGCAMMSMDKMPEGMSHAGMARMPMAAAHGDVLTLRMSGRPGLEPMMGPMALEGVQWTVENTKDGVVLKAVAKDPAQVKAVRAWAELVRARANYAQAAGEAAPKVVQKVVRIEKDAPDKAEKK